MKNRSKITSYEAIAAYSRSRSILKELKLIGDCNKLKDEQLRAMDSILAIVESIRSKKLDKESDDFKEFRELLANYVTIANCNTQSSAKLQQIAGFLFVNEKYIGLIVYSMLTALTAAITMAVIGAVMLATGPVSMFIPIAFLIVTPLMSLLAFGVVSGTYYRIRDNSQIFADVVEQRFIDSMQDFKEYIETKETCEQADPLERQVRCRWFAKASKAISNAVDNKECRVIIDALTHSCHAT